MRFGFHFLDFTLPGEPETLAPMIAATAKASEEVGASWFTVMDHWFQMEAFQTAHDPMLEGYSVLAFAAAHTSTIKLGTIVTGVTYRHPALLVKTATTLDVLSEGRAFLGIGAAWYEREHLALGVPFPSLKERFERLEETLQIAKQMWSDDDGPYAGEHYQLAETICRPRPVQKGGLPIVIGGAGEKKTLKLVAQYADAANIIAPDTATVAHKLEVLRGHCDAVGRDYDEIEITIQGYQVDLADPDDFLRRVEELAPLGVDHVHLRASGPDPRAHVEEFGEKVAQRMLAI